MKKFLLNLSALLFLATGAFAQLQTPAPSPGSKLMQTVGLTEVTIEYSRPSVRGRKIFGGSDALLSYGQIWRTGANAATKISFSKDVQIAGKDLKAGSYAIFTIPGESSWEVMFFNYDTPNSGGYGDKEPVVKTSVKSGKTGHMVESFSLSIENLTDNSATIDMAWENVMVSIPFNVHTEKEVMATFKKMEEGPSANEYYNMGVYLASMDKDLSNALEYIQKATRGADAPRYWQLRQESLVLAKLGKNEEAIKVAKKSLELAKEANNMDYVKLNENSIKEWSGM